MPIYKYQCERCGHNFDEMLSITAGEKRETDPCPECGDTSLKRKISAPAVHMRYSPMHPRHMRGQRDYGKKKR